MLLPVAYFPPIEYFACLAKYSVVLDDGERYVKQSYRNRCRILTANGVEDLRVPIVHNGAYGIREVLVDYSTDWVRRTQYAIESAYASSPFFEYYKDSLFGVMDSRPATLWELDVRLIGFFCEKIGIREPGVGPGTNGFGYCGEAGADGFGGDCFGGSDGTAPVIHPKVASAYTGQEYWQVFKQKFGFVPNLSVMDLLFNEGPESICYL